MALLLNIDTAIETAIISISDNEKVIASVTNNNQKDHASFLQPAIKKLLQTCNKKTNELNAVAVTSGPGSYTGLRVGMASAKGLCYALHIPMITINTLKVIALSAVKKIGDERGFYCPLIDAKRMEVFTAVYDHTLTEIIKPCSMILEDESFRDLLLKNKIYFSGSGASKLKSILDNKSAEFIGTESSAFSMAALSYKNYVAQHFANIASASPFYLKEFYTPIPRA